jgi:hypothetical protein
MTRTKPKCFSCNSFAIKRESQGRLAVWQIYGTTTSERYAAAVEQGQQDFSIVSTARANDWEPYAFLRRLFAELPKAKTVEDFEAPLPFAGQRCD